jgi:predicted PurR-regulated permease PerM
LICVKGELVAAISVIAMRAAMGAADGYPSIAPTNNRGAAVSRFAETFRDGALQHDKLTHLAIRLALLGVLIYWSFLIVRPFIPILVWSIILTVALYPAYSWLVDYLGDRRILAAALITIASFVIVIGPALWLGAGLAKGLHAFSEQIESGAVMVPPPPQTVRDWPVIGARAYDLWELASANLMSAVGEIVPAKTLAGVAVGAASELGAGALKFFAALALAGFLFAPAPRLVDATRSFLLKVVPERSEEFVVLAGATIRGVSQGIIGLSIMQALLIGIALKLAGVPGASTLAFLIFFIGILQIPPAIVLVPVVIWLWSFQGAATALVFAAFAVLVAVLENVLKPIVMGRGLRTPMFVILVGALGGMVAHGVVGLFVGPVILAVGWELSAAWLADAGSGRVDVDQRSLAR